MKILYFCPLWGNEETPFEAFCENVVKAGYDGVEMKLPENDQSTTDALLKTLRDHGLKLIGQQWETVDPDLEKHIQECEARLEWQAAANPLFINSQTGRDWFSEEDTRQILDMVKDVSERTGIKIVHETHRGKFSFHPGITKRYLEADPSLRITADFSHWCNVSESLLEDQAEAVELAISRADHIHTRVGHPQGPQVPDPRAPEWQNALNAHLSWWDAIVARHAAEGNQLTMTTEFGPAPYMPVQPFTEQPVASQWDVNVFMMNLLKERYQATNN